MGSIDGEIPAVWFLISSIGFIILSVIQYKNTGKSFNTIFLSIMAIVFLASYLILNEILGWHEIVAATFIVSALFFTFRQT